MVSRHSDTRRIFFWYRLRYVILAALFVVANTLLPLMPPLAYADGNAFFTNMNNRYYSAVFLQACLNASKQKSPTDDTKLFVGRTVKTSDTTASIFAKTNGQNKEVNIGRWLSPDTGVLNCKDDMAVRSAVDYLGLLPNDVTVDPLDTYLKKAGYTQYSNDPNAFAQYAYAYTTVDSKEKGDGQAIVDENKQSTAGLYYVYKTIFDKNCSLNIPAGDTDTKVTLTQLYTTADGAYATRDISAGFVVKKVKDDQTGSVASIRDSNKSIRYYNFDGQSTTCGELLTDMNAKVGAAAEWSNLNKDNALPAAKHDDPSAITTEQVCVSDGNTWNKDTNTCEVTNIKKTAACTAGSLGWILCEVSELMQKLIMTLAETIGDIFEMDPIAGSDALRNIWRVFVGFANLLLVIAFLVIIFSQATSFGLSAYGIKKMLPRIIAAAILINLSYFICAIALDITNIVGASVASIVSSVPINVSSEGGNFNTGATWGANLIALVSVGLGVKLLATGWSAFITPMLVIGGLAVITIFLIIALRQVLIMLLVIVSPIAFAAMILPNTEGLFKKWQKLFLSMLIMYPVVMFLFYGSKLVGQIIQVANTGQQSTLNSVMTQILVFAMLTVAPFAGLYMYLKNSSKLMAMGAMAVKKLGQPLQKKSKERAQRNKDSNFYQQKKQIAIQTKADAKRRENLVRASKRGAPWYVRGDARSLYQTQLNDAVKQINDKETAMHASQLTRRAAEVLSGTDGMSYKDGKVSRGGVDITNTIDQASLDALQYADKNKLATSSNGVRAVASTLAETGALTAGNLANLVTQSGETASERAGFVAYTNTLAAQAGLSHLQYNTVDNTGNLVVGGARPVTTPPGGTPTTHKEEVAKKIIESGLHKASKDVWTDPAYKDEYKKVLDDYKKTDEAQFYSDLSKTSEAQFLAICKAMRLSDDDIKDLRAERNAARKS